MSHKSTLIVCSSQILRYVGLVMLNLGIVHAIEGLPVKPYHIDSELLGRIENRLPLVMSRSDYRERIQHYLDTGGNPNLLFPRSTTDRTYKWGFLHLAVERASSRHDEQSEERNLDIDLIRYLIGKVGVNARDSHERTALHWASRGPEQVITMLLESGANPLLFDKWRLLPSDYLAFAQVFHGVTVYQLSRLVEAEKATVNRVCANSDAPGRGSFIRAFEQSCSNTQLSYDLLGARILAKDRQKLSVSDLLSSISDVLPTPVAWGVQGLAAVVEHVENDREEKSRRMYVNNFHTLLNKETVFRNTAYFVASLYAQPIQKLTEQGASDLGKYVAKKVGHLLASDDFDGFRFVEQVSCMLSNVKMGSFMPTKVQTKENGDIHACTIFNPQLQTKASNPVVGLIGEDSGNYRYDTTEEERLKVLMRETESLSVISTVPEPHPSEELGGQKSTNAESGEPAQPETVDPILDLSRLSGERSLLGTLRADPSERAASITFLNLSCHHVTAEVIDNLKPFSNLRTMNLSNTKIEQEALQKLGELNTPHLEEVDWRNSLNITVNPETVTLLSQCLNTLSQRFPNIKHLLDDNTLYKLGKFYEEKGSDGLEKALDYYELGRNDANKLAFMALSARSSKGDDQAFRREYRCLSELVNIGHIHGQYLMAHVYKSVKCDTLRNLKGLGVVPAEMNDDEAKKELKTRAIDLYRQAAESGHTRAAKALAQMYGARQPEIVVPQLPDGTPDVRRQLEEELRYWKIANQGQLNVREGPMEYVQSAAENMARIEATLRQIRP